MGKLLFLRGFLVLWGLESLVGSAKQSDSFVDFWCSILFIFKNELFGEYRTHTDTETAACNKGLASGGLTFKRESSCGLSHPNAKPRTVSGYVKTTHKIEMKQDFFAYLRPTETELKNVWKNSVVTFDANILLNFYRYRAETTTTFFSLLDSVKTRSYLTNQAVQEYFNNRLNVISEQEKAYSDLKDSITKNIEDPLNNQRKHPYVGNELLEKFKQISTELKSELDNRSQEYSKRLSNDDILEKIVEIFDKKVGNCFDEKRTNEIYADGDRRYNLDIPPGFK